MTPRDPETLARDIGEVDRLREKVAQLEQALSSRVVLEQAKGILAERHALAIEDAFAVLRFVARNSRRPLRDVAAAIVEGEHVSGTALAAAFAQLSRARAAALVERADAIQERARSLVRDGRRESQRRWKNEE